MSTCLLSNTTEKHTNFFMIVLDFLQIFDISDNLSEIGVRFLYPDKLLKPWRNYCLPNTVVCLFIINHGKLRHVAIGTRTMMFG